MRCDREGARGGGVLVYIKEFLKPTQCSLPHDAQPSKFFNAVLCEVQTGASSFPILAIYRSPQAAPADDERLLNAVTTISVSNTDALIVGDFNAPSIDWNDFVCDNSAQFDNKLLKAVEDNFLVQHVLSQTRFRGQQSSLLDLVLSKYQMTVSALKVLPPISKGDHALLSFVLATAPVDLTSESSPTRKFAALDKALLLQIAQSVDWPAIAGKSSVDEKWEEIKRVLLRATEMSVPLQLKRRRQKPWITNKIKREWKLRDVAWAEYLRVLTDAAYEVYRAQRNKAEYMARLARLRYEQNLARLSRSNPKRFFSHVQRNKRLTNKVVTLKDQDGQTVSDPKAQSELFAEMFSSIYREDTKQEPPPLPVVEVELMPLPIISPQLVYKELLCLRPNKSQGPDEIHPAILRELAPILATPLADLFNHSLADGVVPKDWRMATVCPIFKKGAKHDPLNYRPVSLTSIVCKIMESILKQSIMAHLTSFDVLSTAQHGFVPNRSCTTNLLLMEEWITKAMDEGEASDVLFLDFSKAFDSVNHRLLLHKLQRYNIHPAVITWVRSFLNQRTFRVQVNGSLSMEADVSSGVPQGSVLGPILFLLFVNDIPDILRGKVLLFADDVKLVSRRGDIATLQQDLNRVTEWAAQWDLPLNANKCSHLPIGPLPPEPLTIGHDHPLAIVDEARDLGVLIHSTFKPTRQCIEAANKARRVLFLIKRSFLKLSPNVFRPLYLTIVRPLLEYGMQACCPYLQKDINHIERVQRLATRMVMGFSDMPYEERLQRLNLQTLEQRRRRGDLILTYNIINRHVNLPFDEFFTKAPGRGLRGHQEKLYCTPFHKRRRQAAFSVRVVNSWNSLPEVVVQMSTPSTFKKALDQHLQS